MGILPETIIGQIEFCEAHVTGWAATPTGIGLTAAQVTTLTTLTTNARKSFGDANIARVAAKAATTRLHTDARAMKSQAADLIRQIKAFAELQAVPGNIYAAAQIPAPTPPTPMPAPGKPTDFTVTLNADGSITLAWAAENAAASTGAFFAISRKLPGMNTFVGIGGAPGSTAEVRRASFTDSTIPATAAAAGAQYIVQGFRGTRAGESSDAVIVQFGLGEGGQMVAGIRMAA